MAFMSPMSAAHFTHKKPQYQIVEVCLTSQRGTKSSKQSMHCNASAEQLSSTALETETIAVLVLKIESVESGGAEQNLDIVGEEN